MDERFRDALRRNALLEETLAEGYRPSADAALRARLSRELGRVRRRRILYSGLAAAALLALLPFGRTPVAPVVGPPPAPPAPLMEVVRATEVGPQMEIVRTTPASSLAVVRTESPFFDLARDEELLQSPRVLAIVGHPGAPKRLIVAP